MFWIKNSAADWIEYYWHLCYNLLSPKFVILKQSLQREQIICICADICTFPDLHYRHEQTSAPFDKVSIWSKERAERTVPSLGGHCKQANSAIFCSPLWPQTFMQTLRILCRYCADFCTKNARWKLCVLLQNQKSIFRSVSLIDLFMIKKNVVSPPQCSCWSPCSGCCCQLCRCLLYKWWSRSPRPIMIIIIMMITWYVLKKGDHCDSDDNLCTMIPVLFSILTKGGDARTLSSVLTHSWKEIWILKSPTPG